MVLSVDYKGKLVLITGGGRGIGKGITTALAKGTLYTTLVSSERALRANCCRATVGGAVRPGFRQCPWPP